MILIVKLPLAEIDKFVECTTLPDCYGVSKHRSASRLMFLVLFICVPSMYVHFLCYGESFSCYSLLVVATKYYVNTPMLLSPTTTC